MLTALSTEGSEANLKQSWILCPRCKAVATNGSGRPHRYRGEGLAKPICRPHTKISLDLDLPGSSSVEKWMLESSANISTNLIPI